MTLVEKLCIRGFLGYGDYPFGALFYKDSFDWIHHKIGNPKMQKYKAQVERNL